MNFSWPSGKPKCVLTLKQGAKEFFEKKHIPLESGQDDLDDFYYSVVSVAPIGYVYFEEHFRQPTPGVAICVDSLVNTGTAINFIVNHFSINEEEIAYKAIG